MRADVHVISELFNTPEEQVIDPIVNSAGIDTSRKVPIGQVLIGVKLSVYEDAYPTAELDGDIAMSVIAPGVVVLTVTPVLSVSILYTPMNVLTLNESLGLVVPGFFTPVRLKVNDPGLDTGLVESVISALSTPDDIEQLTAVTTPETEHVGVTGNVTVAGGVIFTVQPVGVGLNTLTWKLYTAVAPLT